MTNLTQNQRKTLERAKAREGKTTPAPWELNTKSYEQFQVINTPFPGGHVLNAYTSDNGDGSYYSQIRITSEANCSLIIDAPNLDDLCRAQADIIAEQARRIEALEAARNAEYRQFAYLDVDCRHNDFGGASWEWKAYTSYYGRPLYMSGGKGFNSEAEARAAGQTYINSLTAPEIGL